jgi:hypothetical protein
MTCLNLALGGSWDTIDKNSYGRMFNDHNSAFQYLPH